MMKEMILCQSMFVYINSIFWKREDKKILTKEPHIGVLFYLARHVVATHLEHLQLVPNLLKIFGTPSSVFVQLG